MDLLQREMKDPRLGFATITRVETARDLGHARVWVSVLGTDAERDRTMDALKVATPWLRRRLGERLTLRHVPELTHAPRRLDRLGRPGAAHPQRAGRGGGGARCSTSPRSCAVPIGSPPSATRTPTATRSAPRSRSPWPRSGSASRRRWSAGTRCRPSSPSCRASSGCGAPRRSSRTWRWWSTPGELSRIGSVVTERADWFARARIVNIDHHVSNPGYGAAVWIDPQAAATCEMVTLLLPELGVPLDAELATALMAGIVQDTHTFAHPNATAQTLRVAAAAGRGRGAAGRRQPGDLRRQAVQHARPVGPDAGRRRSSAPTDGSSTPP